MANGGHKDQGPQDRHWHPHELIYINLGQWVNPPLHPSPLSLYPINTATTIEPTDENNNMQIDDLNDTRTPSDDTTTRKRKRTKDTGTQMDIISSTDNETNTPPIPMTTQGTQTGSRVVSIQQAIKKHRKLKRRSR